MSLSSDRVIRCGVAYYAFAAILLHLLQPALSPIVFPMSPYVLGRGGFLMTVGFFALSASLLAAAGGLWARVSHSWWLRLGVLCAVLGAAATVVAGIFPDDGLPPPTLPSTRVGWTHFIAGMVAFPCFLLGPFLLTVGLRRDSRWHDRSSPLVFVVLALAISVVWFAAFAAPRNMAGLAQRILLVLLLSWLYLVSRLLRPEEVPSPSSARNAPAGSV